VDPLREVFLNLVVAETRELAHVPFLEPVIRDNRDAQLLRDDVRRLLRS